MKLNGWQKLTGIAVGIVAIGGAFGVVEGYVPTPWAPKVTFAIATENKLTRLDSELILLETLLAQAENVGNQAEVRRLKLRVVNKRREIKELEKLKEKHK